MKVSILTLGCKVNQAESAVIEGNLRNCGFSLVSLSEYPDYCIVNTCTVTAKSDYQSRQLIRRAARAGAKVLVTGCYSQISPDEVHKIPGVIDIVSNNNKYHIINVLTNNNKCINLAYSHRSRPYVKVQDGCNLRCTYCIVPKARGKSRSIEESIIIEQISAFVHDGYHEVVLTGIHLGSYGYDIRPNLKLSVLLKSILKKTNIQRIRLSSLEVNEINDELIELLQDKRICDHIHIPLQSGDNTVLKQMNRMYTYQDFVQVIEKVIKKMPDILLGTDVIVGFPGEGEGEFRNTRDLLVSLPIVHMHIFPFSRRIDTLASQMSMQNTFAAKQERVALLKALHIRKKKAYMNSQINKTLGIIIEEATDDNTCIGTSSNYLKVKMYSHKSEKKSLISVRITGTEENALNAVPI
jgi:threonylcarbamoyladenosine tRNA methylthiotransferase MtaB